MRHVLSFSLHIVSTSTKVNTLEDHWQIHFGVSSDDFAVLAILEQAKIYLSALSLTSPARCPHLGHGIDLLIGAMEIAMENPGNMHINLRTLDATILLRLDIVN